MENDDKRQTAPSTTPTIKTIPPHLQKLAWAMDKAFPVPGTNIRFGIDSLVGLIPGVGDFIGLVISAWVVTGAVQAGAKRPTVIKMLGNIAKDALLGAIPVLGDLFDVTSRANVANLELLQKDLDEQNRVANQPEWKQRVGLWVLVAASFAILGLALYGAVQLISNIV